MKAALSLNLRKDARKWKRGGYEKETLGQIKDEEANKIWTLKTF